MALPKSAQLNQMSWIEDPQNQQGTMIDDLASRVVDPQASEVLH